LLTAAQRRDEHAHAGYVRNLAPGGGVLGAEGGAAGEEDGEEHGEDHVAVWYVPLNVTAVFVPKMAFDESAAEAAVLLCNVTDVPPAVITPYEETIFVALPAFTSALITEDTCGTVESEVNGRPLITVVLPVPTADTVICARMKTVLPILV
jgi:hypothetical protein